MLKLGKEWLKFLVTSVTDRKFILEEIKSRLNIWKKVTNQNKINKRLEAG
jgi:hypothetical protein